MISLPLISSTLCNGAGGIDSESAKLVRYESRKEERRRMRADLGIEEFGKKRKDSMRSIWPKHSTEWSWTRNVLCRGARYVRDAETRAALCMGAEGSGPAHCFGRSKSLSGLTDRDRLILCVADGGDPALCVQASQTYLEVEESCNCALGPGATPKATYPCSALSE